MTTEPNDDLTSSDEVEIDLSAGFADDLETASDDVEINLDFGDFSESIERDVELNLDLDGFGDEPEHCIHGVQRIKVFVLRLRYEQGVNSQGVGIAQTVREQAHGPEELRQRHVPERRVADDGAELLGPPARAVEVEIAAAGHRGHLPSYGPFDVNDQ